METQLTTTASTNPQPSFKLTKPQRKAIQAALMSIDKCEPLVIGGYAGTGKTTLIKVLLDTYSEEHPGSVVALSAYTHKACGVLSVKVGREVQTLSSLLKYRPQLVDEDTGKLEYLPSIIKESQQFRMLIVDECSMVPKPMLSSLLQLGKPIIFTGDPLQLPPINEKKPPVFDTIPNKVILSEVLRYDGELLNAATYVRENISSKTVILDVVEQLAKSYTVTAKDKDFMMSYIDTLKDGYSPESQIIAYTNKSNWKLNTEIRKYLYGKRSNQFPLEGEWIIVDSNSYDHDPDLALNDWFSYYDYNHGGKLLWECSNTYIPSLIAYNSQILYLDKVQPRLVFHGYDIPHLECSTEDGKTLRKLTNDGQSNLDKVLEQIKPTKDCEDKRPKWSQYHAMVGSFHQFRPIHACTIHKAQGSEWKHVWINVKDILRNKDILDRNKMFYTALTRASESVTILI